MVRNIWISLIDIGVKANESRRVLERLDRWFVGPTDCLIVEEEYEIRRRNHSLCPGFNNLGFSCV